jgi:endosialidase-like protein
VNREQLREMLFAMRADQLLAASLAGSLTGLRDVLAHSLTLATTAKPNLHQVKALGDSADDVVYTPVTPCRLVETRGTFAAVYQGGGAFAGGDIRNYTAQGGNGVCLTQLPAGLNPSALQLQVFGIPINSGASGDIEILPQGSSFGSTATEVYVGNVAFNTVSTTAKINLANNQIGVQVRGGGANVAIDVVGYFKRPGNYGGSHTITGLYATDSGGFNNTGSGNYSTVGGGSLNVASGILSTVAGGEANKATAFQSTVGGGSANEANGAYATVVGGFSNLANGVGSVAMGQNAQADYHGCFVFGDSSPSGPVQCNANDRVVMRAVGGIFMFAAGSTQATYTGVVLPPGAQAWIAASDRAGKDNLAAVDVRDVLRKTVAMPIATWNWKSQDASIRHMGPMAQDFHAAFGLGETPKGISTVDADGVALAAIQGLNAKVEEQASTIGEQQHEIAELRRMVLELRSMMEITAALR